jgi:hypothetical protein
VYVRPVFVDIVAKHLLTLFVHGIDIVNDHDFLLAVYRTMGLAEGFHLVFEELDALLFQIVNKHDVRFGDIRSLRQSVVFSQKCVQHGRFPGIGSSNQENIQVVDVHECPQNKGGFVAFSRFVGIMGVVKIAQIAGCVFFDKGFRFADGHVYWETHPVHLCGFILQPHK